MALSVTSLHRQKHEFSEPAYQLTVLQQGAQFPEFAAQLHQHNLYPLKPTGATILQVNVGKMCNQTCRHCHVDAGPDRKEIMTRETMQLCLDALALSPRSPL